MDGFEVITWLADALSGGVGQWPRGAPS